MAPLRFAINAILSGYYNGNLANQQIFIELEQFILDTRASYFISILRLRCSLPAL